MAGGRDWQVFWRADKQRWILEYADGNTRRQKTVELRDCSKRQAEAWARGWLGGPVPEAERADSVATLADRFIAFRREEVRRKDSKLSPATVANNASHCRKWIKPKLGQLPWRALDAAKLRAFVRELRDNAGSAQTVRNIHYTLTALLDTAHAEGWITLSPNPASDLRVTTQLPELPDRSGGEDVITMPIEHAQALIAGESVPPIRRSKYGVVFTGGCRAGETGGAQWGDIDWTARTLRVERQFALEASDRDGGGVELRAPKKGSRRSLPLHPCAIAALTEWRELWHKYVGRAPTNDDPIWPAPDGSHARPRFAEELRADLKALGLPTTVEGEPITFHAIRRSVSTWVEDAGADDPTIGRMLGHKDRTVTRRHYVGLTTKLRAALERIPLVWVPLSKSLSKTGGDNGGGTQGGGSAQGSNLPRPGHPRPPSVLKLHAGGRSQAESSARVEQKRAESSGVRIGHGSQSRSSSDNSGGPPEDRFAVVLPFLTYARGELAVHCSREAKAEAELEEAILEIPGGRRG